VRCFFGTNLLSGVSGLAAVPLAKKIGLINTMVWSIFRRMCCSCSCPDADAAARDPRCCSRATFSHRWMCPTRASYLSAIIPLASAPRPTARLDREALGTATRPAHRRKAFRRRRSNRPALLRLRRAEEQLRFDAVAAFSKTKPPEER